MSLFRHRPAVALLLTCLCIIALTSGAALAQSSLGIGAAEPAATPVSGGLFGEISRYIFEEQRRFYALMTDALRAIRENPSAGWTLAGLSFLYGILHAAGPGHGKAVISTYMVANEIALQRGVLLAFISAFLQALVAIAVISAVFLVLRGTAISQTDTVFTLEVLSYAFLTGFGTWLLARKIYPLAKNAFRREPAMAAFAIDGVGAAALASMDAHSDSNRDPHHGHGSFQGSHRHDHHHAHGDVCPSCGHSHMPAPDQLAGERFRAREALSAVVAVGLRPCSGALIILTFAFLNGMVAAGIGSVFAMATGTAITVAALATLAVTAKNVAVRFAGGAGSRMAGQVQLAIELLGASLIVILGMMMLAGALASA
ncbi:nickel/cobalt transporter [Notoacmeibacter sp. MSK16QG-6]|uniref:nickel/cobalt transporter n=1 Tax=Notoacmeibacter sp. MSK16QG-6 TaxID=2957982 RepID=UPI00209FC947|nr:nickel/cobalt transporter [Notoacmeibacter sp. MSK16QG-6]MCP1200387.1 nickel/cobalt transporter [Notoacmeibacter sp. MSK16QG-6]